VHASDAASTSSAPVSTPSPADAEGFVSLGLLPELCRAVAEQGYTQPTPIQARAIPIVLQGRDLLAAAQTGTGKTAGFTLPMLQRLRAVRPDGNRSSRQALRALVLVPTRELAAQVQDSVRTYGKYVRATSTTVYGGVGFQPQVTALRRGVEILVATPGRLLDHIQQRTVDLSKIEILVLDEADRMLDMGFIHDIRRVVAMLPKQRQTLLFSATFSEEIRALAGQFQHEPQTVEVARRNAPIELVTQVVHPVDKDRRRELLTHLVQTGDWRQVLVFCKTKHGASRLAELLERDGIESDAIHGNKSQPQRMRALKRFKDGELQVLVATDIAARGIDIDSLPHVVNFDLPNVPEDYVHRIGRTGRAGSEGDAVSLVCAEDRPLLAAIERLIGKRVEQKVIPGFEPKHNFKSTEQKPGGRNRPGNSRSDSRGGSRDGRPPARGNGEHRSAQDGQRGRPGTAPRNTPRGGAAGFENRQPNRGAAGFGQGQKPRNNGNSGGNAGNARRPQPDNRVKQQPSSWEAERKAQVEHFRKVAREESDGSGTLLSPRKAS